MPVHAFTKVALTKAAVAVALSCAPIYAAKAYAQSSAPVPSGPVDLQPGVFAAIGAIGAVRLDGVRRGEHRGAPVRFVDFTLKNTSTTTTFPKTLQEVWWQGRTSGQDAQPLRRDGTHFGMYDQTVAPGQTIAVTYAIPDRADVAGVTLSYPHARPAIPKRVLDWRALSAAAGQ